MQEVDQVIRTKLHLPFIRLELVPRIRLQEQIALGLRGPLTLITAPAGFGKTTLLASCVNGSGKSIAWLSLDKNDNQIWRFLSYLIAALQEVDSTIGSEAAQLLAASRQATPETILTSLINELDITHKEIILALDDYQFISNRAVHEQVAFLLEHQPKTFHLVIATRVDPPLPLARLRARGQTVELRGIDLRFTIAEATQFLNDVMGLGLDAGSVAVLEERTEGWIAGLQMASIAVQAKLGQQSHLSMRDREDVSGFIKGFSGTNRYILDYLLEEVLASQPPEIQHFLLYTSILERLTAPLCDAILKEEGRKPVPAGRPGIKDEAGEPSFTLHPSSFILEYLERSHLFLVPLEDARIWYRYHHLFADLLRSQLYHGMEPAAVQKLYFRASRWYENQGLQVEAIEQALAAPDLQYAADLLEREILSFFYQSEIAQLNRWLEMMPKSLILQRPLLCAVYAASISMLPPYPPQSVSAARDWMQAAEDALPNHLQNQNLTRAFIFKMRSYWARWCGEPPEIVFQLIATARSALPLDPATQTDLNWLYIRSALQSNLALTNWIAGDENAARQAFEESRRISSACNDLFNASQSINHLIRIHFLHGQLGEAVTLCREALTFFNQHQNHLGHRVPFSGEIGIRLAEILIEQNELVEAEQLIKENLKLAKWTMGKDILLHGNLALARLAAINGNPQAAFEYLSTAEKSSDEGAGQARAQRAALWLALSGKFPEYLDLVKQWGKGLTPVEFNQPLPQIEWTTSLVLAHLALVATDSPQGTIRKSSSPKLAALQEWLERQAQNMQTRGWVHWEIPLLLLKCQTQHILGDLIGAEDTLRQALELAAPGGYVRAFLDEGQSMQTLLTHWLAQASFSTLRDYAFYLLSQFNAEPHPVLATSEKASPTFRLVEPLSQRELEVLQLIALGNTNQRIADELFISVGTVKTHTSSIYRKLDVANRTEAIARARQYGILP